MWQLPLFWLGGKLVYLLPLRDSPEKSEELTGLACWIGTKVSELLCHGSLWTPASTFIVFRSVAQGALAPLNTIPLKKS